MNNTSYNEIILLLVLGAIFLGPFLAIALAAWQTRTIRREITLNHIPLLLRSKTSRVAYVRRLLRASSSLNTMQNRLTLGSYGALTPLMRALSQPSNYVSKLSRRFAEFYQEAGETQVPLSPNQGDMSVSCSSSSFPGRKEHARPDSNLFLRRMGIPVSLTVLASFSLSLFNLLLPFLLLGLLAVYREYNRENRSLFRYVRLLGRQDVRRKDRELAIERARTELALRHKQEIEDVMAMFAHKFRGPLDSVIYNSEHANNQQLYREAVRAMNGLLEIFSLVSTDATLLREKLRADTSGAGSISEVAARSLRSALAQLLSQRGSDRIQQHLLEFARRNNRVPSETTTLAWHRKHQHVAAQLRIDWESSLMNLPPDASLQNLSDWMADRFFRITITGFDQESSGFGPYGTKASLLTILFTEAFTNMIKYCAPGANAASQVCWEHRASCSMASFSNPTTQALRRASKGSGRGHQFLRLITAKVEGNVKVHIDVDLFSIEVDLPANLFWGNEQ